MNISTLIAQDILDMYETLSDAKATYNGKDIDVFFQEDYSFSDARDRTIKAQSKDVPNLDEGQEILLQGIVYEVLNCAPTDDGLEVNIALNKAGS